MKRDIGRELLKSIEAIKNGKGKRVTVNLSTEVKTITPGSRPPPGSPAVMNNKGGMPAMYIEDESTISHAVVGLMIENGWNLVKAWRKHLGLSQEKLANLTGISQSAISQMEQSNNLRSGTVEKLAAAMGIAPEQLVD